MGALKPAHAGSGKVVRWWFRRAPEPIPEPEPLLLTQVIKPTAAEWKRASKLYHGEGPKCRCSTCTLIAELACMIRLHDAEKGKKP